MASLCLTTPNSQSPSSCQIHPLALFSILSSHTTRPATATRVIGTLLGRIVAGNAKTANRVIEVTSSFAVPFKQSPSGEVSFDAVYQRQMVAMQSAITSNEVVVGWFTTSPDGSMIGEESSLIHDFYADECEVRGEGRTATERVEERESRARTCMSKRQSMNKRQEARKRRVNPRSAPDCASTLPTRSHTH